MEKKTKIIVIVVVIIAVMVGGWLGFAALTTRPRQLRISGSTTCLPVIQACATAYEGTQSEVGVTVTGGGSSVGVKDCGEGTSDIGMASRNVKSSEKAQYPTIQEYAFARDGVAVIISAQATHGVTKLTLTQVKQIYEGKITDWSQLGGKAGAIVLIGRDSASGTRETFEVKVKLQDSAAYEANLENIEEYNSNGGVHDAVSANPNAIGYVGLGYVDAEVKALAINNVMPSAATVQSEKYPIARLLYLLTLGDPSGDAQAFINFVLSDEGQSIVVQEGFVKLK